MPPDLSPDEVRDRSFDTALRGYDKPAVDRFRSDVADEIDRLHRQLETSQAQLNQLGIDDVGELSTELQRVGSDITSILDEARRTATELRERAAADAAKWRSDAETETTTLRDSSQSEAEQIRADAWSQSSQMLEQVTQDVENQIAVAKQDALFIRAEAERESLHLTADARREAEDVLRAAKTEADRMMASAQTKASRTLDEARQAAEGAQERARALEARRAELLIELDAARQSIGQLERQIDERREVLEDNEQPGDGDEEQWVSDRTHWGNDDGSVRLVRPVRLKEPTPVDADELVSEVEQLRGGETEVESDVEPEAETTPEEAVSDDPVEDGVAVPETDQEPAATSADADDPSAEDALAETDALGAPGDDVAAPHEEDPPPDAGSQPQDDETAAVATLDQSGTGTSDEESDLDDPEDTGEIDDLFQKLRTTGTDEPVEDAAAAGEAVPSIDDEEPASAPAAIESVEEPVEEAQPVVEPAGTPAETGPAVTATAAVEMRDRLLLPIENRVLRSVKRRIVDLQNRTLEELRIGDGPWVPDRAMFMAELGPDLGKLAQESYIAGHRAAVEMSGDSGTSPPATRTRTDAPGLVVDALVAGLTDSYQRAVAQDSGARQVAAAVSRVFRAWRTDEAERRLRMAGYTAYHEGIVAGLAAMGVPEAVVVAEGAHGEQCPSVTGAPFDPGASSALRLPPAHEECTAIVVLIR